MKRVTYHLTEKQIAGLNALSKETGLPIAEHVRRAIDEYLKKADGWPSRDIEGNDVSD